MNFSVFSLSLSSFLNYPLLSKPPTNQFQNLQMKQCSLSRHFSPILFSNSNFGQISIKKSKIKNILDRAIVVEQFPDENIQFSKHSRTSFTERFYLIVSRTVFSKCTSDKRGGALFVQNDFCSFGLFNSAFYDCSSYFTNGGLFFRGRTCLASQNCFDTCIGRQSGLFSSQAFFFAARNNYPNTLNESSISSSSPFAVRGRDNPGVFWKGDVCVTNINSSYNHILGKVCGITLSNVEKSYFRYNSYCNSSGFSIVSLQSYRGNEELAYLNFVQNDMSVHGSILFLFDTNALLCNSIFLKNTGKLINAAGNWKFQIDSCIADTAFDESIYPAKNLLAVRCTFGTSATLRTIQIQTIAKLLCWNDCGDNKKCAQNIADYKSPNFEELGFPNEEND